MSGMCPLLELQNNKQIIKIESQISMSLQYRVNDQPPTFQHKRDALLRVIVLIFNVFFYN